MKMISYKEFKGMLLYRKVVAWDEETITLDNGIKIAIEETEQDCCACASGRFTDVELNAVITDVSNIKRKSWEEDGETYGCEAVIKLFHNRNLICRAEADADAGNGGYYYSIASLVIKVPEVKQKLYVHFVGSSDKSN